jgi:putative transposase
VKYRFIEQHRDQFPVTRLCEVLGVSTSGYYAARQRQPSKRAQMDERLLVHIRAVYRASRGTYGYRRIYHELRAQLLGCSQHRIARLMRQAGLRAKSRRPYKITTRGNPRHPIAENLLARDFTAARPNQKWVADITYIATGQGWLYLATVMDLFSRQIVGWSMDVRMQTDLVKHALEMALLRRCPEVGLLHHSDRGSQYTSADYQSLLADHGIQVSMSRAGNCYDNAAMESFYATLKTECVDHRFATRQLARAAIFDYIEVWYNRHRRHSSLGYLSPAAFEYQHQWDTITLH